MVYELYELTTDEIAIVENAERDIKIHLKSEGKKRVMTRRVILYPGEDGYVVAEVSSLPGCISQGQTRDEALANIQEAIALHLEVLRERGEPLPDDQVEMVEVAA